MIKHPIEPVYNSESRILILGSFPSVKSRENMFFYGHPQNRFWRVLAEIFMQPLPVTIEDKKQFLLDNHIAIWDVIKQCDIRGSQDSSIENVVPNDISIILENANIERIFVNGKKAWQLFNQFIKPSINREAIYLPSTSPANAMWSLDKLVESWSIINLHTKLPE